METSHQSLISSNNSIFPVIDSIEDIREAIRGNKAFTETSIEDYVAFNYRFGHIETFPNPDEDSLDARTRHNYLLRRECRGILFDRETGALLARPLHKFFNVNEIDETDQEKIIISSSSATGVLENKNITNANNHVVLEKLDGYFVYPVVTRGELKFATKVSLSSASASSTSSLLKIDVAPFHSHPQTTDGTPQQES